CAAVDTRAVAFIFIATSHLINAFGAVSQLSDAVASAISGRLCVALRAPAPRLAKATLLFGGYPCHVAPVPDPRFLDSRSLQLVSRSGGSDCLASIRLSRRPLWCRSPCRRPYRRTSSRP